ncbi:MAG: hypothetical protein L0Y71_07600 [Gemmataceae bacterium]|nr:hypothetical protein [Gemmataceae bacterium]
MIRSVLAKLLPSRAVLGKLTPVFGMVAVGVVTFVLTKGHAATGQPGDPRQPVQPPSGGYGGRVVAYIYGDEPITREELGEFLIARFGAERLDFLVNRRIVERTCKARGIEVTDAMIDAQLDRDLEKMGKNFTRKNFNDLVLKKFKKTMYEWKEDVIRPKLMMVQLVAPMVKVTEEDLRKGFEGRYGPKVECRWIVLPDDKYKEQLWQKASANEAGFNEVATKYNLPALCPHGGKGVPPIHRHFGDPNVERIAFGLKEGDVSPLIGLADKTVVILKCDKHIPADLTKRFEEERLALYQEIYDLKLQQTINEKVAKMREDASPKLLLQRELRQDDLERAVVPEISGQPVPRTALPNKAGE